MLFVVLLMIIRKEKLSQNFFEQMNIAEDSIKTEGTIIRAE